MQDKTTNFNTPQRLRLCFEELGPTFIKLGQLLASRTDVFPASYIHEFKKLQDQVPAVAFEKLLPQLNEVYPQGFESVFVSIDTKPIGSASIAQVHRAQLKTGESVVLKIQKPGIEKIIREDIEVLRFVVGYVEDYWADFKNIDLKSLVEEFAQSMEAEIDFIIEANYVRRFYQNFIERQSIVIPKPYLQHSSSKVLVLEYIDGVSLLEFAKNNSPESRELLLKKGLQAYFSMVFKDGLFHGDLHPGNILVINNEKLAFVDFGMVGRLSPRVQKAIANMFYALIHEDYERMSYEYIDLNPSVNKVNREKFSADLRRLLTPYFGVHLKNINVGKLLLDTVSLATKYELSVPSELLLFFKSLITLEGVARSLKEDFDLMALISDFALEIGKSKYDPLFIANDIGAFSKDMSEFLKMLPLEMKTYLRRMNHPQYVNTFEIKNLNLLAEAKIKSAKILFFALVICACILSLTLYLTFKS
ncbi:phosphotransferase [bacterium]|nr:phosphotransferase [bacterium]